MGTCFSSELWYTLNKPANNPLMGFMIKLSFCGFMRLGKMWEQLMCFWHELHHNLPNTLIGILTVVKQIF